MAALAVRFRDLDTAEDAFGEAKVACLALTELPRKLAASLFVSGKRRGLDRVRRQNRLGRAGLPLWNR